MRRKSCFFGAWALIYLLVGCKSPDVAAVQWSIFSQEGMEELSREELRYAGELKARNVYVPLFRVDYHLDKKQPIPLDTHKVEAKGDSSSHFVPFIRLSNRIFLESDSSQLSLLAEQMSQRILQFTDSALLEELLFDCAWTPNTRESYFKLIQEVRGQLPYGLKKLSVSLPLHYLRYSDTTGLPPVDKVLLSLVDQINLQVINEKGDPLDPALLRPYLMNLQAYGTELEVGIPFGHWGILVRNNHPIRLFTGISREEIEKKGELVTMDEGLVKVSEDAYFQGEYLNRGDFIRMESYQSASIKALFPLLLEFSRADTLKLCMINLEKSFVDRYPPKQVETWFSKDGIAN